MHEPALLEVIRAVASGAAPPEELVEALEVTRSELEGQRHGFEAALARESPAVQQAVGAEVAAVTQSLDDYRAVLESCAAYLRGFERAFLDSALENLPRASARLDLDFFRFREAALSARGPYTHPGVNALLAAADGGEGLAEVLELELARQQVRDFGQHALSALLARWGQDYARVLASPVDEAWFAALEELGERYARIDAEAVARRQAEHPTGLPTLNLALNAGWLVLQERVEPEVCLYFLQTLEQSLGSETGEAAQGLREWCDRLGAWLEQPDPEGHRELVEAALAAAEAYRQSF